MSILGILGYIAAIAIPAALLFYAGDIYKNLGKQPEDESDGSSAKPKRHN
jgi:hypothetical protein